MLAILGIFSQTILRYRNQDFNYDKSACVQVMAWYFYTLTVLAKPIFGLMATTVPNLKAAMHRTVRFPK